MAGKRAYVACTACVWKGRRVKGKCNCRDENEPSCLCSWGICPRCSAKVDTAKTVGRTVMFCGVGICDKDEIENFEAPQIRRLYAVWRHMLIRSTPEYAEKFPGYAGCSIDPEFVKLSGFIKWALKQVGSCTTGFQIDKDILVLGNKRYGPDVCAFVPPCINSLFLMQSWTKSGYPQGVKLDKQKFVASCHVEGGRKYIGTFESCELAFAAYKQAKEHEIKRVADMWRDQIDPRVYQALVEYKVTPRNQEKSA